MIHCTDKSSFFNWINSYEGELIIKKNKLFNQDGELVCMFSHPDEEQPILKAAEDKENLRNTLISYFTSLACNENMVDNCSEYKIIKVDDEVYYTYENTKINIKSLSLDQLFVLGTLVK